ATVENGGASASTLTVNVAGGSQSFAGTMQNGGGTAALALTKTGAGQLVLAGTNTYTGTTALSAGTLALVNPFAMTGSGVTISNTERDNNTTFRGSGTVAVGSINDDPNQIGVHHDGVAMNNALGTLYLTGSSNFSNGLTITVGTVNVTGTAGNVNIAVNGPLS